MKLLRNWKVVLACLGLVLATQAWAGDTNEFYKGRLKPELVASLGASIKLAPASSDVAKKLPSAPEQDDSLFTVTLSTEIRPVAVVVVIPKQGEPYLYADVNGDGKFESTELLSFQPREWISLLKIPHRFGILDSYAMSIHRPRQIRTVDSVPVFQLDYSSKVAAVGTVHVDGHDVAVQYAFDLKTNSVDLKNGLLGMDCNGDGKINWGSNSPEKATGYGKSYVFRVGEHYLSTESVDLKTGEIVLRSHPASDYKRVEFVPGTQIPEFAFNDLNGKPHKFSDYRGKYLLMVFWGSW